MRSLEAERLNSSEAEKMRSLEAERESVHDRVCMIVLTRTPSDYNTHVRVVANCDSNLNICHGREPLQC